MNSSVRRILLNPPFGLVKAPQAASGRGGRITEAAIFIVTALQRAKPGVEVLAILPDVLRSGSFSQNWRNRVSELAEVDLIEPYGIFDRRADVDVFLLRLVRRSETNPSGKNCGRLRAKPATQRSADDFDGGACRSRRATSRQESRTIFTPTFTRAASDLGRAE